MKNIFAAILFCISIIALPSCSPQFSNGGWVIPSLFWGGTLWFVFKYNQTKEKAHRWAYLFCLVCAIVSSLIMAADL